MHELLLVFFENTQTYLINLGFSIYTSWCISPIHQLCKRPSMIAQGPDLIYLRQTRGKWRIWILVIFGEFLRANTASKQPRRSNLTQDLKSVTLFTYISMCILLIWQGPFWWPLRPLQPQNSNLTSDLEFVAQIAYATMLFGLFRPSLEVSQKIKKETDYTCVALRAAGKNWKMQCWNEGLAY